jgi:hypothetical protein
MLLRRNVHNGAASREAGDNSRSVPTWNDVTKSEGTAESQEGIQWRAMAPNCASE